MTEKKEKRMNEIIEAAITEFIEKGYEFASMESIANRAKLSKGGLYHHFKNKAEILYMANVKLSEPVHELMLRIEDNLSIAEGLKVFVTDYLHYWNQHKPELRLYFLTMNESFSNPQILHFYRKSSQQTFEYFAALFAKGQTLGVFKEGNAQAMAISFISCLDGFLGYLLLDPSISLPDIEKEIQHIFIHNALK